MHDVDAVRNQNVENHEGDFRIPRSPTFSPGARVQQIEVAAPQIVHHGVFAIDDRSTA
jgi:hypothetical protein